MRERDNKVLQRLMKLKRKISPLGSPLLLFFSKEKMDSSTGRENVIITIRRVDLQG